MPRTLRLYIVGVVAVGVIALIAATLAYPPTDGIALRLTGQEGTPATQIEILLGIGFWVLMTALASALPVQMPRGARVAVSIAPIMAAIVLGGPAAGGWVAALGTTEVREVQGRIPWYGTLANHAGLVIPAVVAGIVYVTATGLVLDSAPLGIGFLAAMVAAAVFYLFNVGLASSLVALRTGQAIRSVAVGGSRGTALNLFALAPLAWLMAQMYLLAWWATLLFALPLYTTRVMNQQFVEMREMFTQTIGALAEAVDKRDPFTSKHSLRVKEIAVDIGRQMRVNEKELEALEWGGLLHDVGKIGVPDAVLLKQDRLDKDERAIMNSHPVKGAEIIHPVRRLSAELPIIRHHHEWYNGSGYPDRLIGEEIPKLARILHVADAFEAMTAQRPYRMVPLTPAQALAELRKFAGIQFDPAVVDAFVRTKWVEGVEDPSRGAVPIQMKPRTVPFIGGSLAQAEARVDAISARVVDSSN